MARSWATGLARRGRRFTLAAGAAVASLAVIAALLLPALVAAASPTPAPTSAPTHSAAATPRSTSSPSLASATPRPLPSPLSGGGVDDFAGVFRADTVTAAEQSIGEIAASSGPRIVVVTLAAGRSVTKDEAEADARRIDEDWGVGKSGAAGGLVILYDLDSTLKHGQVVLYAGEGFETRLPQDARQRIFDYEMLPRLQTGDLDGSLTAGLIAIATALTPVGPVDSAYPEPTDYSGVLPFPDPVAPSPFGGGDAGPVVLLFALAAVLVGLGIAFGSGQQTRRGGALGGAVARRRQAAPLYLSNAQRETASALRRLVAAGLVEVVKTDGGELSGVRVVAGAAVPDDLDEQARAILERLRAAADADGFVPRVAMPPMDDVHQAAREAFAGRRPRQATGDWTWWWPVVLFAAEPDAYAQAVAQLGTDPWPSPGGFPPGGFPGSWPGQDGGPGTPGTDAPGSDASGSDGGSGGGGGWAAPSGSDSGSGGGGGWGSDSGSGGGGGWGSDTGSGGGGGWDAGSGGGSDFGGGASGGSSGGDAAGGGF